MKLCQMNAKTKKMNLILLDWLRRLAAPKERFHDTIVVRVTAYGTCWVDSREALNATLDDPAIRALIAWRPEAGAADYF